MLPLLRFPHRAIKLVYSHQLQSSMEQLPQPHSAPTSSFAEGMFFWLWFQPPTNFAEFEFRQGLLMKAVVIERGIIAGLVTTAAPSAIMLMKQSMELKSDLDSIAMITAMAAACGCRLDRPFCDWGRILGSRLGHRQSLPAWPTVVARSHLRLAHMAEEVDRSDAAGPACVSGVSA